MKHLIDKLEQTHAAWMDEIISIPNELQAERKHDVIEEVFSLPVPEFLDLFGLPKTKTNLKKVEDYMDQYVEDNEETRLIYDLGFNGLIASACLPVFSNFRVDENGKVISCSFNIGRYHSRLIYADSFEHLFDKLIDISEVCYQKDFEQWNKKQEEVTNA